jgi:hypothetical protein
MVELVPLLVMRRTLPFSVDADACPRKCIVYVSCRMAINQLNRCRAAGRLGLMQRKGYETWRTPERTAAFHAADTEPTGEPHSHRAAC